VEVAAAGGAMRDYVREIIGALGAGVTPDAVRHSSGTR
jgi:hypothetical protein